MTDTSAGLSNLETRRPRSLRIALICRALPIHRLGGLEYHARDLAVALVHRGHEVHVLTTSGGAASPVGPDGTKVYVHEIPGTKPGDYSIGFFRNTASAARALCAQHDIHILCPIDLSGLFLDPADFTAAVLPIIHGTMTSEVPLDWRYWRHLSRWKQLLAVWKHKSRLALMRPFASMVRRAYHVMVDSEFTRRELYLNAAGAVGSAWKDGHNSADLAQKVHVVPLGISPDRYPLVNHNAPRRDPNGKLRIVLLGRLQRIKGLEVAILAAGALRARGVDFTMSIGGTGEFEAGAKQLVHDLDLHDFVHFDGRVEPGKLSNFFAEKDVFLFPDLTQPAFGLVAVEAMYYGLPVVAARSGAIPEVVSDQSGWLYEPWDVNSLAGLLTRLAQNPDEIAQKKAAAITCNREFTAEKMAERAEKILLLALRENPVGAEENGGADETRTRDLRRDRPAF